MQTADPVSLEHTTTPSNELTGGSIWISISEEEFAGWSESPSRVWDCLRREGGC